MIEFSRIGVSGKPVGIVGAEPIKPRQSLSSMPGDSVCISTSVELDTIARRLNGKRVFTEKITKEELAEKIWSAWQKDENIEEYYHKKYSDMYIKQGVTIPTLVERLEHFSSLSAEVVKDLKKVNFDCENVSADPKLAYGEATVEGGLENYVGLHTLNNGLSYLGVTAGGDWEYPIFFIIYWDGSKLRGYIPKEGNTWNTKTKSALGNDEEEDAKFLAKRGIKLDQVKFDFRKIEADIKNRIKYKSK